MMHSDDGLNAQEVKGPDEGYVQAEIRYVCPKLECRDVNGLSACFFHSFDGIPRAFDKKELPNGSDFIFFGQRVRVKSAYLNRNISG
jgi:hypothetical protein